MKKLVVGVLLLLLTNAASAFATNLLTNSGFETGDYTGWSVGGNSTSFGVAIDGTPITGANPLYDPDVVKVHSGQFAGYAVVSTSPIVNITLSQNVNILADTSYDVGFWFGSGAGYVTFGALELNIYIDGTQVFHNGYTAFQPNDYKNLSTVYTSATDKMVTVTYDFAASGTALVGASFDDFYFTGEPGTAAVPEPSTFILLGAGLGGFALLRRRMKK